MTEQFDLNTLNPETEWGTEFPYSAYLMFADGPKQIRAYGPTVEVRTLRAARLPNKWISNRESNPVRDIPHDLARTILGLDNVWTVAERMEAPSTMDNHFRRFIADSKVKHYLNYSDYIFEIHTPFCD